MAECAIEIFQFGEALLVVCFDAFNLFDDGGILVLKVNRRCDDLKVLDLRSGELGLSWLIFGQRTGGVKAFAGSEVHLLGTQFLLVRQPPIPGLSQIGDSVTIETGVQETLYGMFADGNTFYLDLSDNSSYFDYFDPNATLRLTLVPEPASSCWFITCLGMLVWRSRV